MKNVLKPLTIENEAKEVKGGFISMLLCTLGNNMIKNLLKVKWIKLTKISGQGVTRAGEGVIRAR